MKLPLLAAIVLSPCLSFAGTSPTAIPPEVTQQLSVMTTRLNLSQSQQDKIRPFLVEEWTKKQAIAGSTLSEAKKHDAIFANHRASLQKIKAVFTKEQMAKIEQEQDHPAPSSTSKGS
ncbi:hypothetical protein BH09VER1_BH09VER1_43540 [soil metagenome]